jgi:ribonuclease HI
MDIMNFDGSCDPNPGGRMGFGWVITWDNGNPATEGKGEKLKHPENTNNVAEYTALKEGILQYLELGGNGPLQVYGDSKLVISQMSGDWQVKNQNLTVIHKEINETIKKHDLKIKFEWVPREKNSIADSLAMPKDTSEVMFVKLENRRFVADTNSAAVSPQLRLKINELNTNPAPSFKSFTQLKVGGLDSFSKKRYEELVVEAGKQAAEIAKNEFPGDTKNQAATLRWMLRGLGTDLAIQKAKVDADISKKHNNVK